MIELSNLYQDAAVITSSDNKQEMLTKLGIPYDASPQLVDAVGAGEEAFAREANSGVIVYNPHGEITYTMQAAQAKARALKDMLSQQSGEFELGNKQYVVTDGVWVIEQPTGERYILNKPGTEEAKIKELMAFYLASEGAKIGSETGIGIVSVDTGVVDLYTFAFEFGRLAANLDPQMLESVIRDNLKRSGGMELFSGWQGGIICPDRFMNFKTTVFTENAGGNNTGTLVSGGMVSSESLSTDSVNNDSLHVMNLGFVPQHSYSNILFNA